MANSLNRDIEPGEVLVLRKSAVFDAYHGITARLFVARSGVGLSASATGSKIKGENYSFEGGGYVREGRTSYSGHEISVRDTKAWQKEHGKFLPESMKA